MTRITTHPRPPDPAKPQAQRAALPTPATLAAFEYDAAGRRIVRAVTNAGDLDATYHDYHDGQRVVEIRNGSDAVLKQHVWGQMYIDELCQITINGDPVLDPEFDPADPDHDPRAYHTLQDANFNVTELYDDTGSLIERYTYDPYGSRQVYVPEDGTDTFGLDPIAMSTRVTIGSTPGIAQPYGLNEVGHQGLFHDESLGTNGGLIHNRARTLHPRIGRFLQRDPLGYVDGMSTYAAYHVMYGGVDPLGLNCIVENLEVEVKGVQVVLETGGGDHDLDIGEDDDGPLEEVVDALKKVVKASKAIGKGKLKLIVITALPSATMAKAMVSRGEPARPRSDHRFS